MLKIDINNKITNKKKINKKSYNNKKLEKKLWILKDKKIKAKSRKIPEEGDHRKGDLEGTRWAHARVEKKEEVLREGGPFSRARMSHACARVRV